MRLMTPMRLADGLRKLSFLSGDSPQKLGSPLLFVIRRLHSSYPIKMFWSIQIRLIVNLSKIDVKKRQKQDKNKKLNYLMIVCLSFVSILVLKKHFTSFIIL